MTAAEHPGESPMTRELKHTRKVVIQGFLRSDQQWDLEAELEDIRAYESVSTERGTIPAGGTIHGIRVCVTVNDALLVTGARAIMTTVPYSTCPTVLPALGTLKGASIGPGWRKAVDERLGDIKGCTHIRELLAQIATAAYQTIPVWHAQKQGDVMQAPNGKPPHHLGTCATWSFTGPVVARLYPQFSRGSG